MKKYILINSLGAGGAERQASIIARYIKFDGIILLERDIKYSTGINKFFFLSNFWNKTPAFLKTIYIPFYAYKLSKIVNSGDTVLSFLERSNTVNILTKILFKTGHKVIISERTSPEKAFKWFTLRGLVNIFQIKLFYHYAETIIANSFINFRKINRKVKNVKFIPNPIILDDIKKLSKEKCLEDDKFKGKVVISAGRLIFAKGHWHLIRAFSKVKKEIKSVKLLILGEGNLKNYLLNLIKKLGLEDDVYLLGYKQNPFKYFAKADIFVLSSLWEGFPNVLIEAMACKLPVIASSCSTGVQYVISGRYNFKVENILFEKFGVLIPQLSQKLLSYKKPLMNDEIILANAIIKLLKNKNMREKYINNGVRRVKNFDVKKIIKMYKGIL